MKSDVSNYFLYCIYYVLGLVCKKYVLTTLGFHYPTIFQAWQAFESLCVTYLQSGNLLQRIKFTQISSWLPAMIFNVFTLYMGSIALSQCPVPIFISAYAASDAMLLLLDNHMPGALLKISLSIKLFTAMFVLLYVNTYVAGVTSYLCCFMIFHGFRRCVYFWYAQPAWPQANLSRGEQQFLNDSFAVSVLFPVALIRGHHQTVYTEFPHLFNTSFYVCFVMSGLLNWLCRLKLHSLQVGCWKTGMIQLLAKIATSLISMQMHLYPNALFVWCCVFCCSLGDVLFIIGKMQDDFSTDPDKVLASL